VSNSFIYLKSQTASGNVNLSTLQDEITSAISSPNLINLVDAGEEFAVVFDNNILDSTLLDQLIGAHTHLAPEEVVKNSVKSAIEFGNELIITFASENVLMGITQAGKTKEVADYTADIMRYAQSGALYEVMAEADRLIAAGLPVDLEPFITEPRLLAFKQKVQDYLT